MISLFHNGFSWDIGQSSNCWGNGLIKPCFSNPSDSSLHSLNTSNNRKLRFNRDLIFVTRNKGNQSSNDTYPLCPVYLTCPCGLYLNLCNSGRLWNGIGIAHCLSPSKLGLLTFASIKPVSTFLISICL